MINFAENLNKMITAGLGGETEAPDSNVAVGFTRTSEEASGDFISAEDVTKIEASLDSDGDIHVSGVNLFDPGAYTPRNLTEIYDVNGAKVSSSRTGIRFKLAAGTYRIKSFYNAITYLRLNVLKDVDDSFVKYEAITANSQNTVWHDFSVADDEYIVMYRGAVGTAFNIAAAFVMIVPGTTEYPEYIPYSGEVRSVRAGEVVKIDAKETVTNLWSTDGTISATLYTYKYTEGY